LSKVSNKIIILMFLGAIYYSQLFGVTDFSMLNSNSIIYQPIIPSHAGFIAFYWIIILSVNAA